jgi:hypothetical protein
VALGVEPYECKQPQSTRASPQDSSDVVSILVSAFFDHPTWSWAFPDPAKRAEQHTRLWGLFVDGAVRYPWVWLTRGNTATSVWIPPNGTEFSDKSDAVLDSAVVEMLDGKASRVLHMLKMFEQFYPRGIPHFSPSLLGTRTEHRGYGSGLQLLAEKPPTDRSDRYALVSGGHQPCERSPVHAAWIRGT